MQPGNTENAFWHPHQRLWNQRLLVRTAKLPGGKFIRGLIIIADSALLLLSVAADRVRRLGPAAALRPFGGAAPRSVLYVDCGTHKDGRQVQLVHKWFSGNTDLQILAFEAGPDHFEDAKLALEGLPVDLRNVALVGPKHNSKTIRLYRAGGTGLGDSLFAQRGAEFDEVPAQRLSELLRTYEADRVLLRMNIEGAEQFVVDDLIDARMTNLISGYFGMWDDLSKIDAEEDAIFRRTLLDHNIRSVSFNGRDVKYPFRLWAVRLAMDTALSMAGSPTRAEDGKSVG